MNMLEKIVRMSHDFKAEYGTYPTSLNLSPRNVDLLMLLFPKSTADYKTRDDGELYVYGSRVDPDPNVSDFKIQVGGYIDLTPDDPNNFTDKYVSIIESFIDWSPVDDAVERVINAFT